MTLQQTKALIKLLKEAGVVHFKNDVFDISFKEELIAQPVMPSIAVPLDAPQLEAKPIEHKIVEVTSLLKLSDKDLVDRLFPDTFQEEEESA